MDMEEQAPFLFGIFANDRNPVGVRYRMRLLAAIDIQSVRDWLARYDAAVAEGHVPPPEIMIPIEADLDEAEVRAIFLARDDRIPLYNAVAPNQAEANPINVVPNQVAGIRNDAAADQVVGNANVPKIVRFFSATLSPFVHLIKSALYKVYVRITGTILLQLITIGLICSHIGEFTTFKEHVAQDKHVAQDNNGGSHVNLKGYILMVLLILLTIHLYRVLRH